MHDKRGKLIEVGDVVIGRNWGSSKDEALKVIGGNAQSDTCNLMCISYEPRVPVLTINAKDSLLIVKADGSLVDQGGS